MLVQKLPRGKKNDKSLEKKNFKLGLDSLEWTFHNILQKKLKALWFLLFLQKRWSITFTWIDNFWTDQTFLYWVWIQAGTVSMSQWFWFSCRNVSEGHSFLIFVFISTLLLFSCSSSNKTPQSSWPLQLDTLTWPWRKLKPTWTGWRWTRN